MGVPRTKHLLLPFLILFYVGYCREQVSVQGSQHLLTWTHDPKGRLPTKFRIGCCGNSTSVTRFSKHVTLQLQFPKRCVSSFYNTGRRTYVQKSRKCISRRKFILNFKSITLYQILSVIVLYVGGVFKA
jgi:hypothetical protein